ncbi:MAG TPA: 4Fe-4S dicluster domain-containing protein [Gammaproteobacteria bacterium]|nr:4Fe-4S dicluster domain-containing protein [Gammaproteobacteria bacterium]
MTDTQILFLYLVPMVLVLYWYVRRRQRQFAEARTLLEENLKAGLTEPASLHPVVDEALCLGCGSCVSACPEGNVLGLIDGRAKLVNATHCIGHGACKEACPFDAIELVFGTEKRGVDIPLVKPNFETNMPGIFIAGELGGMGLIRNAVEQGRQAIAYVAEHDGIGKGGDFLDVLIVGAGPSGFSASLGALERKMNYVTIEQESLGGTVSHFPRGKLVMTAPVKMPVVGKMTFNETTKEELMAFWEELEKTSGVKINYNERLEDITPEGEGYRVKTSKGEYLTRTILLCIGRRGTPRKLGVEGEELPKVVYRLIDAEQYQGQHVLVVGGGDSALEAATSIAEQPGTTVTLSYRSAAFSRAKEKNRQKVAEAEAAGRLRVIFNSNVVSIDEKSVRIDEQGEIHELPNDAVIVSAGGVLPTPFLKKIGIQVETHHGKSKVA